MNSQTVYVFKVYLPMGSRKRDIWRIIALRPNHTLEQFHKTIQRAFSRIEDHHWILYLGKPGREGVMRYSSYKPMKADYTDEETILGAKVMLSELTLRKNKRYYYLYNFMYEWWHPVYFLGEKPAKQNVKYPATIELFGSSPPEHPFDYEGGFRYKPVKNSIIDLINRQSKTGDVPPEYKALIDSLELKENVSFQDLEIILAAFEDAHEAPYIAGVLRGLAAGGFSYIPSWLFFWMIDIQPVRFPATNRAILELLNVLHSILRKFSRELSSGGYTIFRPEYKGNIQDVFFEKCIDIRSEIAGFLKGLIDAKPRQLDEQGFERFRRLAQLDIDIYDCLRSKRKLIKRGKYLFPDGWENEIAGLWNKSFELICWLSVAFRDKDLKSTTEELVERTRQATYQNAGRNDPCPCGSGKKYKKCCMNKKT